MKQQHKKGILLVTFGTSYPKAKAALDNIDRLVRIAFPDIEIRWAYTSKMIRRKLIKRGENILSPAEAMAKMNEEEFTHVAVQSLHVIPGDEFDDLRNTITAFGMIPKNNTNFSLGAPLLFKHEDMVAACNVLEVMIPKERKENQTILFMGHGTSHYSNVFYPAMQYYMWQKSPLFYMGTVEGFPELSEIIPQLKAKNIESVCLIPFLSVAGDHAINDMAGDDKESWKSILETEGFQVDTVMQGMGEFDDIVALWIEHLKTAVKELED